MIVACQLSMAALPVCYNMPHKDQSFPIPTIPKVTRHGDICGSWGYLQYPCCHVSSELGANFNRLQWQLWTFTGVLNTRFHQRPYLFRRASAKDNSWSAGTTNRSQLRSLDSYFGKLQEDAKKASSSSSSSSVSSGKTVLELVDNNDNAESNTKMGLTSLDAYLSKLDQDSNSEESSSIGSGQTPQPNPCSFSEEIAKTDEEAKWRSDIGFRLRDVEGSGSKRSEALQQHYDEAADHLYLISILASINIAVFLFEMATPVRSTGLELFSIPSLYGAKINHLIVVGEWWRLLTPMFLHSGILHVALGCWALLSFGPQVCRRYGPFTFFFIYLLGGVSGNLISFLHTPEPTVGGTGPVFAVIGAWLIYQIQNKDVIAKDISERMFRQAMLVTALSFILSKFGPIDDWTHLGAAVSGIVYGFLTCPTLQVDDTSSRSGQEEQIRLVGRNGDPCKSLIVFTVFIVVFSSVLFLMEPPLNTLPYDDFA